MKKSKIKASELIAIALLMNLTSTSVLAQGHVGNGGGEDIEFHKMTSDIQTWVQANLKSGELEKKLSLTPGSAKNFSDQLKKAVDSAQVKFQDEDIIVSGQLRVCGNDSQPARIICNRSLWRDTPTQVKYGIVLHEYLGVAGIEKNILGYSQYPISQKILSYAFEDQVYSLRMEKKIIDCVLRKTETAKNNKVSGPLSGEINFILDNGMPEVTRIRLSLDSGNNSIEPSDKFLNMQISLGTSKAAGINKSSVYNRKAFFGDTGNSIVHVVKTFNDKKILISEWDEVEAEDYLFDLKKKTLTIKQRVAYFMFGPKRTVKKATYECDLR